MKNFIAFRFCDNDFHHALRQSVEFLVENVDFEERDSEQLRKDVAMATNAFSILNDVEYGREHNDHQNYIFNKLSVLTVDTLSDLENNGEGYVVNTHTLEVSYYGY